MASGPFAYQYMQAQGQGLGGGAFGGEPSYTNGMPDTLDRQNYGQPGPSFLGGHPSGGVGGMQYGMKPPMGNEYVPGDAVEGGGHGAEGSNDNRLGAADEDGEGNGKRRRVQRACDVSSAALLSSSRVRYGMSSGHFLMSCDLRFARAI